MNTARAQVFASHSAPNQADASLPRTKPFTMIAKHLALDMAGVSFPDSTSAASQFLSAIRHREVLSNLGARELPLNTRGCGLIAEADASEVLQGRAIPLSKADFYGEPLTPRKIAALLACTKELLSSPLGESALQNALYQGVLRASDASFISAATDTTPALVTGISTAFQAGLAVDALTNAFDDDTSALDRVTVVMNPATKVKMIGLRGSLDVALFPELERNLLRGIPVLTSRGCPKDKIVAVDASKLVIGFGSIELSLAKSATLEFSNSPTASTGNSDDEVTAQSPKVVSLFQADAAALKAIRELAYLFTDTGAVAWLDSFTPSNTETSA